MSGGLGRTSPPGEDERQAAYCRQAGLRDAGDRQQRDGGGRTKGSPTTPSSGTATRIPGNAEGQSTTMRRPAPRTRPVPAVPATPAGVASAAERLMTVLEYCCDVVDLRKLRTRAALDLLGTIAAVAGHLKLTAPGVDAARRAVSRVGLPLTGRRGRRLVLTTADRVPYRNEGDPPLPRPTLDVRRGFGVNGDWTTGRWWTPAVRCGCSTTARPGV